MTSPITKNSGYVCVPYLHNHDSIELKDLWVKSKNIQSLFFATATFSTDSKPYFTSTINHFLIAKFKNDLKTKKRFQTILMNNRYFFLI